MALRKRKLIASDTFDSSIDGNWVNGPADFGALEWISGGHLRVPSGGLGTDCGMRRIGTFAADQYAKTVIQQQSIAGGSYGHAWAIVRMQDSATDESCYFGQRQFGGSQPTFHIWEMNSTFGATELAYAGPFAISMSAGDYIVLEVSDDALTLYSYEVGGSETVRVTVNDGTVLSGTPGIGANADNIGNITVSAWEGGDLYTRYAKFTDTFDSSIGAHWTNPHDNLTWQAFGWITGGYAGFSNGSGVAGDHIMSLNSPTLGGNHYIKQTYNLFADNGDGGCTELGVRVQSQSNGYIGGRWISANSIRFELWEVTNNTWSTLASFAQTTADIGAGESDLLQADGTTITLFVDLADGHGLRAVLNATDASFSGGRVGAGGFRSGTAGTLQITAVEAGDDVPPDYTPHSRDFSSFYPIYHRIHHPR